MDIAKIDENFKTVRIKEQDVVWKNALEQPFSLHGIYCDKQEKCYRRIPHDVAKSVSAGVEILSTNTAGGRLRFKTDSPYIAIRSEIANCKPTANLGLTGMTAFSIYANNAFQAFTGPEHDEAVAVKDAWYYTDGIFHFREQGMRCVDVYFPSYNNVKSLYIGLKYGAKIERADKYPNDKPVVFYGSSITQGGCASHSGNDYASMLSRWLNFDYINLGFSGTARAEREIAEYIASLDMSVFVYDYDYNAPYTEHFEHLRATHATMYDIIRKKHPDLPIIMLSKPNFAYNREASAKRRAIIYDTYCRAKARGEKVAFIDGETLFGDDWELCPVDATHPNDFGFYKMAKAVEPILRKML